MMRQFWRDVYWIITGPFYTMRRSVRLWLGHGHLCEYRYDRATGLPTDHYTGYCNRKGFHRGRNA